MMPYGGTDLYSFMKNYVTEKRKLMPISKFLIMMKDVLAAIQMMDKKKWCHQDIKTPNILVTPQGNSILIDYSLMVPYDKMYGKNNRRRLKFSYFPYPPEFKIAYYKWNTCVDLCSQEEEALKNMHQFGLDRWNVYTQFFPEDEIRNYLRNFIKDVNRHNTNLEAWLRKYANRVDIYSFGMSIIDIFKYIDMRKLQKKANVKSLWDEWMRSLIHPDPRKRATPKEAWKTFEELEKKLSAL